MPSLWLKPVDSFLFEGMRGSTAGERSVMYGIFPPRPSTIYGALRSSWIYQNSDFATFYQEDDYEVKRWMGTPSSLGDFAMKASFVAEDHEPLLPVGLDNQLIKDGSNLKVNPLALTEQKFRTSTNSPYVLTVGKDEKKQKSRSAAHIYLTRKDWKALILSGRSSSSALSLDKLISHYAKVGIAIDPQTRIVEEKMLYRVDMSQMRRQVGFIVYLDRAPDFSTVKYLRLGGANRPWVMKKRTQEWRLWNEQEIIKMAQQIRQTGIARIILLSPALWQNGSRPAAFDQQTRCLKLPSGLKVEAVAWAVGRPEVYGGWDIARHRPKARKNLAVAGTVIYVKVRPEQIDEFIRLADGFTLTDELAQQGYGFAVTCSCQNIDLED